MEAIILAGGRGTRLKTIWDEPKCLLPIHGRPFLDYLLKSLSLRGFTRFVISIGFKKNLVKLAFEDSDYNISWCEEDLPLGTAGAVKKALDMTRNRNVFVINGDTFFLLDPFDMMQFHRRNLSLATVALRKYHGMRFINGGFTLINSAMGVHLENHTMFEKLFDGRPPMAYVSDDYFLDVGTPENYAIAQEDFLKFD